MLFATVPIEIIPLWKGPTRATGKLDLKYIFGQILENLAVRILRSIVLEGPGDAHWHEAFK